MMPSDRLAARPWTAAMVAVLLSGCASTEPPACALPELDPYDDATLARAADELAAAPEECVICEMVIDYGRLRAQIRALRGEE